MRKTIHEPAREIPVVAEADVVVCGGGPGGLPAAIAAARHGAKVVLIERYGFLGGLATAGLVAPILAHKAAREPLADRRGPAARDHRAHARPGRRAQVGGDAAGVGHPLRRRGAQDRAGRDVPGGGRPADAAQLITDVVMAGRQDRGRAGREQVGPAGGDRARCSLTPPATPTWPSAPARRRPTAAPATAGRSRWAHSSTWPASPSPTRRGAGAARRVSSEEMDAGRLPASTTPASWASNANHRDHTSANMTRFGGDSDNAADMTRAELSVRRDVWELVRYLRANVPGFEDCYVQQISPQVGPRESRQIVGPYALTGDDVHLGRKFDDAIARGSWWIDIHCPLGNTYPVHLCRKECPKGDRLPILGGRARADAHERGALPAAGRLVRHPLPLPALGGRAQPAARRAAASRRRTRAWPARA